MCFSETTFALRHRSKRTVLISDSSAAGVFPVIARSIRTAFQVRQACAALPRNSMLSKESSIQDPQFVANSVQSHIFLVLTFWTYWHAAQVLILLKNLLTAASCSWVSSQLSQQALLGKPREISWCLQEKSGVSWLKQHLLAVGTLLKYRQNGAWQIFLQELHLIADCLCESDRGLKRTSDLTGCPPAWAILGMRLNRSTCVKSVPQPSEVTHRTAFAVHAPNTFLKDAFRIDSALGRAHCRDCSVPTRMM